MRKTAIAVAIISLFVVPALAQTPPAPAPVRVRGTVEKLDGQNLTVKSRDGQSLAIALAPNIIVSYLTKRAPATSRLATSSPRPGSRAPTASCMRSRFASSPRTFAGSARGNTHGI